jgi:hypothetical protein
LLGFLDGCLVSLAEGIFDGVFLGELSHSTFDKLTYPRSKIKKQRNDPIFLVFFFPFYGDHVQKEFHSVCFQLYGMSSSA